MICREALLMKLLQLGITREMLNFIKSFLTNRSFQVRIDSSYSEVKNLENGVPQGSILSPILFSILINDLPDVFSCPAALYADDCCFCQVGTDISQLNNIIQDNLNSVQAWCSKWGFEISLPKSAAVLFTRKRTAPDKKIKLNQTEIPIKSEFNISIRVRNVSARYLWSVIDPLCNNLVAGLQPYFHYLLLYH